MCGGAGNRPIVASCKQKVHRPLIGTVVKALTLLLVLPVYPFFQPRQLMHLVHPLHKQQVVIRF
jgi:hypothetical protein